MTEVKLKELGLTERPIKTKRPIKTDRPIKNARPVNGLLENLHLRTIDFLLSPGPTRTRSTTWRKSTFVYFCIFLYILEPLAKSRLGLGLLIETATNITIVVGKRHLCPRSECELFDSCKSLSYILLALPIQSFATLTALLAPLGRLPNVRIRQTASLTPARGTLKNSAFINVLPGQTPGRAM